MCDDKKDGSSATSGCKDTDLVINTERLIHDKATPNWEKDFPVVGEGTIIFSIERSTPFGIVIRPKLPPGQPGGEQWISLEVQKSKAIFKMSIGGSETKTLKEVSGTVKSELVGYEEERKISYWFSYDRDELKLKYGKGYQMEETTLMTHGFLTGGKQDEKIREQLKYLFSPTIRRHIEQYDIEPTDALIQRYAARIRNLGFHGRSLQQLFPDDSSEALGKESEVLAKSIIDIEQKVAFDKDPFACNWSPLVLDSAQVNMFELDGHNYTFSASLPSACLELYSNVTAKNVALDWSPTPEKYMLSDAIRHSINSTNGALHKKLKSKSGVFGRFDETYLRVTLGSNRGSSPGIPYVLEIWPKNHGSPIHNHGNAYAVIKVLHGGLTIKVFNKHVFVTTDAPPLQKFDVKAGDITWISPNWFQTHQLWNYTDDYAATVQCYQYGTNDFTHWPYFDYVAGTDVIHEFLPDSDYTFHEMRSIVLKEYEQYMEQQMQ